MKYEKRTNKDGSSYYSFVTSDRKRLSREQIRERFGKDILTEDDAKHCVKLLEAKFEAEKIRIMNRLTWEKEFYNFNALLDQYLEAQKKAAPNSWANNEFYCRHYVLYYFLQVKRLNNIELWTDHYDDFKEWLDTKACRTKNPKKLIAYSSKNHAVKSLNTFMQHLYDKRLISTFRRCPTFEEHLLKQRDLDDVVNPDEMERVYKRLIKNGHKLEAVYFRYLYFSGMRFNEGLCISLGDLEQGELEQPLMKKKLKSYNISYFGFLVSEGQFDRVSPNGEVIRAPFKGQKKIDEKFNRVLPIIDKELWNQLVDLAEAVWKAESPTKDRKHCRLFAAIDDTTATRRLREAFKDEKLKWRSWHCLRHSRATLLIGETGDAMLARLWLGHTSPRTIEKYNHIYQAITRSARTQKLTGKTFGLKKV